MPGQKRLEFSAFLNDIYKIFRNYNAFGAFHRRDGSIPQELQAFLDCRSNDTRNYIVFGAFHRCDASKHEELQAFLNTILQKLDECEKERVRKFQRVPGILREFRSQLSYRLLGFSAEAFSMLWRDLYSHRLASCSTSKLSPRPLKKQMVM